VEQLGAWSRPQRVEALLAVGQSALELIGTHVSRLADVDWQQEWQQR